MRSEGGDEMSGMGGDMELAVLREVRDMLLAKVEHQRALLRRLEWLPMGYPSEPTNCPICWGSEHQEGHGPDCPLARALA